MEPTGKFIKKLQCKDRKARSGKSMIETTCIAIGEFFYNWTVISTHSLVDGNKINRYVI